MPAPTGPSSCGGGGCCWWPRPSMAMARPCVLLGAVVVNRFVARRRRLHPMGSNEIGQRARPVPRADGVTVDRAGRSVRGMGESVVVCGSGDGQAGTQSHRFDRSNASENKTRFGDHSIRALVRVRGELAGVPPRLLLGPFNMMINFRMNITYIDPQIIPTSNIDNCFHEHSISFAVDLPCGACMGRELSFLLSSIELWGGLIGRAQEVNKRQS